MPVRFFNEKNGQTVTLTREPQIAAFVNSSNMSINASQGQDFGWRLDAEDVIRIEEMRKDMQTINRIAQERGILAQDLKTQHFITEILRQDALAEQMRQSEINDNPVYKEAYEARIRAAREAKAGAEQPKAEPKRVEVTNSSAPVVVPVKKSAPKKPTTKK